jgi:hypothetical protein
MQADNPRSKVNARAEAAVVLPAVYDCSLISGLQKQVKICTDYYNQMLCFVNQIWGAHEESMGTIEASLLPKGAASTRYETVASRLLLCSMQQPMIHLRRMAGLCIYFE